MSGVAVDLRLADGAWRRGLILLLVVAALGLAAVGSVELGLDGHRIHPSQSYDPSRVTYDDALNLGGASVVAENEAGSQDRLAGIAAGPSLAFSAELLAPQTAMRLPTAESWGNPRTLVRHFRDHGADFAARTADEYAEIGSNFFQRGLAEGLATKLDPKSGVIRVYDPASNTFGAFNPTGTTRTIFKPDPSIHGFASNWDYWLSQPGYVP